MNDERKNVIMSLRLRELDFMLIKRFAEYSGMSTSEFVRTVLVDHVEQEYRKIKKLAKYEIEAENAVMMVSER